VRWTVAFARRAALAAGADLALSLPTPPVVWTADAQALFTLLKNLIENAVQHAPLGSIIDLEVEHHGLCVRDYGPGVDAELLPRLFERFWRGEHGRDQGTGLGLSIFLEITLAHGWTLDAERAEPALRMRLRVPSLYSSG